MIAAIMGKRKRVDARKNPDRDPDVDELFRRVRRLELLGVGLLVENAPAFLKWIGVFL